MTQTLETTEKTIEQAAHTANTPITQNVAEAQEAVTQVATEVATHTAEGLTTASD